MFIRYEKRSKMALEQRITMLGVVKVGISKNVGRRAQGVRHDAYAKKVRMPVSVYTCMTASADCAKPIKIERYAHKLLAHHHVEGEWFFCSPGKAVDAIVYAAKATMSDDKWEEDYDMFFARLYAEIEGGKFVSAANAN